MHKIRTLTYKILCYGGYAVICQMCAILLFYSINISAMPAELAARRIGAMLEYSLMSIVIILVGALLLYIVGRQSKDL